MNSFVYKEKYYRSLQQYCQQNNVPLQTIYKIRREKQCSIEDALDIYHSPSTKRRSGHLKAAASLYGLSYNTLRTQYNDNLAGYIEQKLSCGDIFPHNIHWACGPWEPCDEKYKAKVFHQETCVRKNQDGIIQVDLPSVDSVPFSVQLHPNVVLIRGILLANGDFALNEANMQNPFVKFFFEDGRLVVSSFLIGKSATWPDAIRLISAIVRIIKNF